MAMLPIVDIVFRNCQKQLSDYTYNGIYLSLILPGLLSGDYLNFMQLEIHVNILQSAIKWDDETGICLPNIELAMYEQARSLFTACCYLPFVF